MRTATLNEEIRERVYAGVLGKLIGVYLGRAVEGWRYEAIRERFGEIANYVHHEVGMPLIVPDDDLSGTFVFFRALEDHGYDPCLSARQIGETWLNYIIEDKTILWWGRHEPLHRAHRLAAAAAGTRGAGERLDRAERPGDGGADRGADLHRRVGRWPTLARRSAPRGWHAPPPR